MSVRIKICGVTDEAAVEACVAAGVDWVGFVFFARSPRFVTPRRARALAAMLPPTILPVGLFVRPVAAEIEHVMADVDLAALQIYDAPARIASIRAAFPCETWEACPVDDASMLPVSSVGDRMVIEARAPAGSDRPGGNGVSLDWHRLAGWTPGVPWLLAGGLHPANVADAIAASGAAAVDVSSGVESAPGVKDPEAVSLFAAAARGAAAGASPPRHGAQ